MTDRMILIITHKEDYTCDFLINKLNQRNIKYLRLNCEDLINLEYVIDKNLQLNLNGVTEFTSIWFRRTRLPELLGVDHKTRLYLLNEFEALLKNLFCVISGKWLSDPFSIYKAENKLLQLKKAKEIGFQIPDTLLTNSKDKLSRFYIENKGHLIVKPLSQSKIVDEKDTHFLFTNIVQEKHIKQINDFDLTPCIYQEEINKDIELRVTVVGNKVFAAGVNSQTSDLTKVDWRKGKLDFFVIKLPQDIKKKCLLLVKQLGLKFGAIDLVRDKHGNYIFLEINPNGQWAWIESETGLKISEAIINELL